MDGLRSRVVFAPAGSGKTERLSTRYIELLQANVRPERILALTFTEKAAAEMKERIFQRLEQRDPRLYRFLRQNAVRMRVSTIHSFCLDLVRRFASSLELDPRVDVLADTSELWNATKYDTLMAIAESEQAAAPDGRDAGAFDLLLDLITRDDRPGWPGLSRLYDGFFAKRVNIARGSVRAVERDLLRRAAAELSRHPLTARLEDLDTILPADFSPARVASALDELDARSDLFLTKSGTPRRPRGKDKEDEREWDELCARYHGLLRQDHWAAEFLRRFELFRHRFLDAYTRRKRAAGQVDYDDMESLALHLLNTEPDWQNVLRAFDEHTDHLLVDEFQDTSFLQWGIIDKLTEEWRSGEGAKQAKNVEPTVFLVGDDKQSIYMFRDAKVEVFRAAADRLEEWLGPDRLERVTLEDNYRSLQGIIDFNNALFSRLMAPVEDAPAWRTRYAPFTRARDNAAPGRVEVVLDPCDGSADERRERDAANVCRRILALLDPTAPFQVHVRGADDEEHPRACTPGDIAILIRSRGLLATLERALGQHNIPFLVAGGTGFYSEPEVRYAIALLAALVDPADGLALYATLRGPVFEIPEHALFLANNADGLFLLDRVRSAAPESSLGRAVAALDAWRREVRAAPLACILEEAMAECRVWEKFWEPQRHANLRKLLRLIEDRQAAGEAPLRILRALHDAGEDEAKADVRPEGLDAVQVMTIHAAKGLQFPVVFLPGLDESIRPMYQKSGEELVIEETGPDEVVVSWIPDPGLRRGDEFHMQYRDKEIEEEKRVFYVACTRARDGLFLTGTWHDKADRDSRLGWMIDALGLKPDELALADDVDLTGVTVRAASDIPVLPPLARRTRERPHRVLLHKVTAPPPPRVKQMSRHLPAELLRPNPELLGMGDVIHAVLESVSMGRLEPCGAELEAEIRRQLAKRGLTPGDIERQAEQVRLQLEGLRASEQAWSIIAPRGHAETELPVMYSDGATVYSGRIDRVIFEADEVRIYDYKTFEVDDDQLDAVVREYYDNQLFHYAAALRRIYPAKRVSTYLVFTATSPPRVVPADPA